ncbi:PREDICTED: endogenous retrovirus group K member 8 Gag polyprotein-like [Lepidothrix coronata]|uniref:Endogenous retrovirus group K member 8 Gag polyprotein-like n=1 Tax=Lepidothrix coronata TaxID=321398 RepID=A0A6J0I024_9PASS|nr:PREDICTED: endogenous retrovirus group K member 8 Gag polyprotein-like [Lepidothrix coronata]
MGMTLSTSEKFIYRRLKDYIIEHGHPLDKKSAKALAKWLEQRKLKITEDTTVEQWEAIGFQLWRAGDKGDQLGKKAILAWRLVLMVLQHQMMNKNVSTNNKDADISKKNSESTKNTDKDIDTIEKDTTNNTGNDSQNGGREKNIPAITQNGGREETESDSQNGGRARKNKCRSENGVEEAGPWDRDSRKKGGSREGLAWEKRRRAPVAPPSRPPPSPPTRTRSPSSDASSTTPTSTSPVSSPDTSPSRKPRGAVGGARAKAKSNIRQDGRAHKARDTEAYPACRYSDLDLDWVPCSPERQRSDVWKAFREEATGAQDIEFLRAFPVYYDEGREPEWKPISYPMLKDIKKAIVEYGLGAPFTTGLLESFFLAYTLIPFDVRAVIGGLLTTVQVSAFETEWKRNIVTYVNDRTGGRRVAPKQAIDMLYGEGDYSSRGAQTRLDPKILDKSKELALGALKKVADAYVPTPSFTMINQGPKELFTDFITRLKEAIARQVPQKECQEILFNKLVIEKGNEDCQKALKLLKEPTLLEMIEACKNVGSNSHKARLLAAVFSGPNHCFECGEKGHFRKHCPRLSASTPDLPKTLCKRCGKGRHWTSTCRSTTDVNGEPLSPCHSPRMRKRVTFSSLPDLRSSECEPSGNGEQSARGSVMTQMAPALRSILRQPSRPVTP